MGPLPHTPPRTLAPEPAAVDGAEAAAGRAAERGGSKVNARGAAAAAAAAAFRCCCSSTAAWLHKGFGCQAIRVTMWGFGCCSLWDLVAAWLQKGFGCQWF